MLRTSFISLDVRHHRRVGPSQPPDGKDDAKRRRQAVPPLGVISPAFRWGVAPRRCRRRRRNRPNNKVKIENRFCWPKAFRGSDIGGLEPPALAAVEGATRREGSERRGSRDQRCRGVEDVGRAAREPARARGVSRGRNCQEGAGRRTSTRRGFCSAAGSCVDKYVQRVTSSVAAEGH